MAQDRCSRLLPLLITLLVMSLQCFALPGRRLQATLTGEIWLLLPLLLLVAAQQCAFAASSTVNCALMPLNVDKLDMLRLGAISSELHAS